ncbi:2-iminoacetate synthase ThiH [Marinomonas sp. 2405UD68-3]|uniref:2-iminoacetate synthase ThiH n=1 Tax=Marinomonas sp. 2405UD68-3 TaxID=3391835 RepID=UPI0039C8EB55
MSNSIAAPLNFIGQSTAVQGQFSDVVSSLNWQTTAASIDSQTAEDVRRVLVKKNLQIDDFITLVSPAAQAFLPEMVAKSQQLTRQRFGFGMSLFAPLYLSNTCANECSYCGFSMSNPIKRLTLNESDVENEVRALKTKGFDHILLVTGETSKVSLSYFKKMLPIITPSFNYLSMEIQPLEVDEYSALRGLGLNAVLVYQETYNKTTYAKHHIKGKKSDFNYRLDAPDRIGQAQVHKIGLGVLLGLDDWRTDSVFLAHHLRHLQKQYWRSRFSISFPRIRPCEGGIEVGSEITDKQLVQLVCAWRLFDADVELSLSTRESAHFRDHVLPIGFTSMSAESKTQPGGYAEDAQSALKQFEISDERQVSDIAKLIQSHGLEVIWKDWDKAYNS